MPICIILKHEFVSGIVNTIDRNYTVVGEEYRTQNIYILCQYKSFVTVNIHRI